MTDGAGEADPNLGSRARADGRRGASEAEVVAAIRHGPWGQADGGRRDSRLEIPFDADWNGRRYAIKQVRPVFADEADAIVVVTVYVYCF